MNFNDDDSILYQDDSRLRPLPDESSRQMFPGPFKCILEIHLLKVAI